MGIDLLRTIQRLIVVALAAVVLATGCAPERRKSDAELGLDPQQSRGRRVFDNQCARCHEPYSSSARKGPTLKNLYKKPYLPSGMPANDERVSEVILRGRKMMPAFDQNISEMQLADLLTYLKTL